MHILQREKLLTLSEENVSVFRKCQDGFKAPLAEIRIDRALGEVRRGAFGTLIGPEMIADDSS